MGDELKPSDPRGSANRRSRSPLNFTKSYNLRATSGEEDTSGECSPNKSKYSKKKGHMRSKSTGTAEITTAPSRDVAAQVGTLTNASPDASDPTRIAAGQAQSHPAVLDSGPGQFTDQAGNVLTQRQASNSGAGHDRRGLKASLSHLRVHSAAAAGKLLTEMRNTGSSTSSSPSKQQKQRGMSSLSESVGIGEQQPVTSGTPLEDFVTPPTDEHEVPPPMPATKAVTTPPGGTSTKGSMSESPQQGDHSLFRHTSIMRRLKSALRKTDTDDESAPTGAARDSMAGTQGKMGATKAKLQKQVSPEEQKEASLRAGRDGVVFRFLGSEADIRGLAFCSTIGLKRYKSSHLARLADELGVRGVYSFGPEHNAIAIRAVLNFLENPLGHHLAPNANTREMVSRYCDVWKIPYYASTFAPRQISNGGGSEGLLCEQPELEAIEEIKITDWAQVWSTWTVHEVVDGFMDAAPPRELKNRSTAEDCKQPVLDRHDVFLVPMSADGCHVCVSGTLTECVDYWDLTNTDLQGSMGLVSRRSVGQRNCVTGMVVLEPAYGIIAVHYMNGEVALWGVNEGDIIARWRSQIEGRVRMEIIARNHGGLLVIAGEESLKLEAWRPEEKYCVAAIDLMSVGYSGTLKELLIMDDKEDKGVYFVVSGSMNAVMRWDLTSAMAAAESAGIGMTGSGRTPMSPDIGMRGPDDANPFEDSWDNLESTDKEDPYAARIQAKHALIETGQLGMVYSLKPGSSITAVCAIGVDHPCIVMGTSRGEIIAFNVQTRQLAWSFDWFHSAVDLVIMLRIRNCTYLLASADEGQYVVLESSHGLVAARSTQSLRGAVTDVKVLDDEAAVIAIASRDGYVRIWDLAAGKLASRLGQNRGPVELVHMAVDEELGLLVSGVSTNGAITTHRLEMTQIL
eukprot:Clim_evm104s147 gene=Clim_evmTU104s147